jgi:hypothetical protein
MPAPSRFVFEQHGCDSTRRRGAELARLSPDHPGIRLDPERDLARLHLTASGGTTEISSEGRQV